jgi:hypothetical protein
MLVLIDFLDLDVVVFLLMSLWCIRQRVLMSLFMDGALDGAQDLARFPQVTSGQAAC